MKKLAFLFGALVMGFMITSCGESVKDSMMKEIDAYFTAAEQLLDEVDNVDDFLAFAEVMNDRTDLLDDLEEKFGDKSISDADSEAVDNYMYDRATAYNQAESVKCSEFLVPAIDRYEAIVNKLYEQFQSGSVFSDEDLDEFLDAYYVISDFSVCENIDPDLVDRLDPVFEREDEMSETIIARLDEMYPTED